ncbi:unnamed protein product [Adineta steineri]|uniref:SPRY domain-containing protein n=1 Tax=Adineta steineri TaxID=433720 RepID=A0A815NB74_9BILA|nr:unnamed protein product [Adineta steineri]CAF1430830.1 unnamed protein product [Adineta steineri]CAF3782353.1 unnamed protein product [Adineta steineri]CAF3993366.1 unnamed protein product [Adineta steineri]
MDDVIYHHDLLQQQLNEQDTTSSQHPLMMEINNWERESVEMIRRAAEKARCDLDQLLTSNKKLVKKELEKISTQLKTSKEADDYSEKNLTGWLQALEKLKNQLSTPRDVKLQKTNDKIWLRRPEIVTVSLNSLDKFEIVCGNAHILENGLVAEHKETTGHAEVCGFSKYSTGTHKIGLKIEKMTNNQWMFWGIISQNTTAQKSSYASKSANGWAKCTNQVYFNGKNNNGYNNYQGDIVENDIVYLTLNCDRQIIELENERTKQKYSIPIDLNGCPFPWQLHINLQGSSDRIRILA